MEFIYWFLGFQTVMRLHDENFPEKDFGFFDILLGSFEESSFDVLIKLCNVNQVSFCVYGTKVVLKPDSKMFEDL